MISNLLDLDLDFKISNEYVEKTNDIIDLRDLSNARKEKKIDTPKYIQVFESKHGYINNLSILDLIFSEGPNSVSLIELSRQLKDIIILSVTDSSGNTDTCEATVTVEPGLSLEENLLESINIYPNPTANILYIKSNYSLDYDLFNIVGQKIKSGSLLLGNNEINVKRLSDGVYFLNFFIGNKTYSRKIVIKK